MDLEPLHRGVYKFLVLVTAVFTTSVQGAVPQPSSLPLQQSQVASQNVVPISQTETSEIPSFYGLDVGKIEDQKTEEIVEALESSSGLKVEFTPPEEPVSSIEVVQKFHEPLATPIPTPTPVPTPQPTKAPAKKAVLASTEITKQQQQPEVKGSEVKLEIPSVPTFTQPTLNADLVFQMINDHRAKLGLTPFEKEAKLCSIAEYRRPQLNNEIFGSGYIHKGFRELNLPYWITENMAGYGSEVANFNWWLSSSLHRSAIEGNYKYSCGACDNTTCAQLFTSYIPK
jgi:uncharacterized protein YkwD